MSTFIDRLHAALQPENRRGYGDGCRVRADDLRELLRQFERLDNAARDQHARERAAVVPPNPTLDPWGPR